MRLTILVGAAPYELDASAASWLEHAIRRTLLDDAGRPIAQDASIRACLLLADVIREDLERGYSPEPVEVGVLQAEGLCAYILRAEAIEDEPQLAALHAALLRLRPVP